MLEETNTFIKNFPSLVSTTESGNVTLLRFIEQSRKHQDNVCLCGTSKLIQLELSVTEHECLFGRQKPLLGLEVHA